GALKLDYSVVLNGFAGANAIAADNNGSAYLAGGAFSPEFPFVEPLQAVLRGVSDAFLTKLSPNGEPILFSTYLGGSANDIAFAVAVDQDANAYLGGSTLSADFPVTNAFQPKYGSTSKPNLGDGFVARIQMSTRASTIQVW